MKILNFAPHLSIPARDGADRRSWELHKGLVALGADCKLIARHCLMSGHDVRWRKSTSRGLRDFKLLWALYCFVLGKEYWGAKQAGGVLPDVRKGLSEAAYDACLVGFAHNLCALDRLPARRLLLVDTHNYDPECFAALERDARSPLVRSLCRRAARRSQFYIQSLPRGAKVVSVSDLDASRYAADRPDLEHWVVPNGCQLLPRTSSPSYTGSKRCLIFVGSLSAKMNQDALRNFDDIYWPHVRDCAYVRVVGSSPSNMVRALCEKNGWALYADVSESDLARHYAESHFSIMPFAYGAGSKLKLFEACGRNVPVLSTRAGVCGVPDIPPMVLVSDDPLEWRRFSLQDSHSVLSCLERSKGFAARYAWSSIVKDFYARIVNCLPHAASEE